MVREPVMTGTPPESAEYVVNLVFGRKVVESITWEQTFEESH